MKQRRHFGELELSILDIVKASEPVSVKEVHDQLPGTAYTTILTVLTRLAQKGALTRFKEGRRYLFELAQPSETLGILQKLKQRLFGDRSAAMISYLIEEAEDLKDEELDALEEMIRKAKER